MIATAGGIMTKTAAFILAIVLTIAISALPESQTVLAATHPPITATLLGQTGQDIVGTSTLAADGIPDVHVRLTGVSGAIGGIRITGGDGIWEMPFNNHNWLVAAVP